MNDDGVRAQQLASLLNATRGVVDGDTSEVLGRLLRDPADRGSLAGPMRFTAHCPSSATYAFGNMLTDLDRELRRSERFLTNGSLSVRGTTSSLELVKAERGGSIDFTLELGKGLAQLLLSDPLQLLITVSWLWERRPRRWGSPVADQPRDGFELVEQLAQGAFATAERGKNVSLHLEFEDDGRRLLVDYRSEG